MNATGALRTGAATGALRSRSGPELRSTTGVSARGPEPEPERGERGPERSGGQALVCVREMANDVTNMVAPPVWLGIPERCFGEV